MTLNLNTKTKDALNVFKTVTAAEDATPEEISAAIEDYVTAIAEEAGAQVRNEYNELKDVTDNQVLQARGIHVLTATETKFYNEVVKKGGFDEDLVWPETIFERVFEDLQKEHPILRLVNFSPTVGLVKVIKSRRKGVAVFGPLHKDLEGRLDAEFGAIEYTQLALTAFFLISNDTLDLGPRWINRYIQICLKEAVRDVWAQKIIIGKGLNEPTGLMKNLDGALDPVTGRPDKASAGTLTFKDSKTMIHEISGVMKLMSKYIKKISPTDEGTEEFRTVDGKVYFIVNPTNYYDIVPRATIQTDSGAYITNLPFVSKEHVIQSVDVPAGKLIAFVEGEYDATQSRGEKVKVYSETFAMKRATLYAVDMLGNGEPTDNFAAQVYDLAIPGGVVEGSESRALHQESNPADYSAMTVEQLKAVLDEKEIAYDGSAKKADLIALLEG